MMASIGHLLLLEFHKAPVDWYWLAVLFVGGATLILIGAWRQSLQVSKLETSLAPQESGGDQWKYPEENSEKVKLQRAHDEEVRKLEAAHAAELSRASAIREQLTLEKQEALRKVSELEARLAIFSPLQAEVFTLHRKLTSWHQGLTDAPALDQSLAGATLEELGRGIIQRAAKINEWSNKIGYEYADKFSSEMTALVNRLGARGLDVSGIAQYSGNYDGTVTAIKTLEKLFFEIGEK